MRIRSKALLFTLICIVSGLFGFACIFPENARLLMQICLLKMPYQYANEMAINGITSQEYHYGNPRILTLIEIAAMRSDDPATVHKAVQYLSVSYNQASLRTYLLAFLARKPKPVIEQYLIGWLSLYSTNATITSVNEPSEEIGNVATGRRVGSDRENRK